ncbi:MAG: hypothetical protein ABFD50_06660 [Smithella sp.]
MISQNKFFAAVFINLMLISAFCGGAVNALDYVPVATVYTDAEDMLTRFSVWALSGEVSADGTSFGSSCEPALTHYSEYEYYTFVLYAKDNPLVEISVPDTYAGIDVELWDGSAYVLRTGNASFTLSVPYTFNSSSVPPADWGTMPLAQPSGSVGSLRRVQLAANTTALSEAGTAQLRIKIYYTTEPAIPFDGVNDYTSHADSASLRMANPHIDAYIKAWRMNDYDGLLGKRKAGVGGGYFERFYTSKVQFVVDNTTNMYGVLSSNVAALNTVCEIKSYFDGSILYVNFDGTTTTRTLSITPAHNDQAFIVGYNPGDGTTHKFSGVIYNLTMGDGAYTGAFAINASSFSGGSDTTVTDFSGAGNHGTAYGNVQYKANLISGYQLTFISLEASIDISETVISWYGEIEMFAALSVVLMFFIITLFAYYKMQNSTMVLLSAVFALMVNVLSLSSGIPFSPFPQLFLSIVELMLLVYARRMNI